MNSNSYSDYQKIRKEHKGIYAREIAAQLNISEAQLLHCRVGQDNVQRLSGKMPDILQSLASIGVAKGVTRNEYAVNIQIGQYDNARLSSHVGLFLNPRALDLRMFFAQWRSAFSLVEETTEGLCHSIQFFDKHGDALHKVFTTKSTNLDAWQTLIKQYITSENRPLTIHEVKPFSERSIDRELAQKLEQEWRNMTDVHQFFTILKNNNLSRQQVFRVVSRKLAWQVPRSALSGLLSLAHQAQNEIMLFVGNRGCVQIFTGKISEITSLTVENTQTHWLNIIGPNCKLHIIENGIAECWVTRKPTKDGFVTSLEVFDTQGNQIIQMYGQRTEGTPEQDEWCKQVLALPHI
ncbi:hemin-degrading factor [Providencia rettgeri]|uniref:hemin-degrading factor n=1 Tax=Providencia TaxID=586 RepID=UPI001B38F1C5|nr:ChuX/HutX family heme-like substrate-binding protein [Providencia rettgeri]MBQ0330450.1 hemin-degrading factor [Providencia rettgeri]